MLTKIREKSQGAFAWVILTIICVPFALWGINNYMDGGREAPLASVGDKDFYQRDVNQAYEQYSQNFRGLGIDEQILKAQALQKLIKDEVLLQYVHQKGLTVTDANIREFIKTLPYFQTDGQYDDKKYKALLASQQLSSTEFVARIRNALVMEQFQRSIADSSIASQYDVESFYKIQNQQRDIDYVTLTVQPAAESPNDDEIAAYYQQHQDAFQTPEQVSIEYVELSLADIAKTVHVSDDPLKTYYEEQKDQYSTPERRKISHILFAITDQTNEQTALAKAQQAKKDLAGKDFAALAAERSDDKLTAKSGGDLGLFTAGALDPAFEQAATSLKQGEVSEPVKSSFGYHLIKVTELLPGEIKPFDSVKAEVTTAYQKSQAENAFYEAGEKLTELSYQNPENLQAAADTLHLKIQKSSLFSKDQGAGIAADAKIRSAAFSEEVLQGNNSSPIELGDGQVVVLRMQQHDPAAARPLSDVKQTIADLLSNDRAKARLVGQTKQIKARLMAGAALPAVAAEYKLDIKSAKQVLRRSEQLPLPLREAVFRAAKPVADKPTAFSVALPSGEQIVGTLNKVSAGVLSDQDKKQLDIAQQNIAATFGQTEFTAVLSSLEADADITTAASAPKSAE